MPEQRSGAAIPAAASRELRYLLSRTALACALVVREQARHGV